MRLKRLSWFLKSGASYNLYSMGWLRAPLRFYPVNLYPRGREPSAEQ